MKKKDSDIEFYREALARMQQEKTAYAEECAMLREENRVMSESHRQETEGLRQTLESLRMTILDQTKSIEKLTEINKNLMMQLENAMANSRLANGKRFAPTTEQSNLLNNRRTDKRAEEKDNFDGNPPSVPPSEAAPGESDAVRSKKKSQGRMPAKEEYDCDEVMEHPLGSYFKLPDGCVFKTRNGQVEVHYYVSYEFIPGRVIKHVWHTASYTDAIGDTHNTLPQEVRQNPVSGCPFTPGMLAFILVEKYAYHTPKNRIKIKLRQMGVKFSKSTFIRYYQLSEKALRDMLEPVLVNAILECHYLMIDETCELVGIIDPKTHISEYCKKYLWALHDKANGLVWYLYEHGSRSREVIARILDVFMGSFSSDGYGAYKIFGNKESYPNLLHCGCWTHVRRNFIEAISVASDIAHQFIDEIELLFDNERAFKNLPATERAEKRQKLSLPILNRIFAKAKSVAANAELMAKSLLKKAVNYINNQTEILRNFILDGNAEISNNLCEQRMKPIKLSLKNCQNIGSEEAAENAAFMHSLIESCRMNNKNPYDYLCSLFRKMLTGVDDVNKRKLLPDLWVPEC